MASAARREHNMDSAYYLDSWFISSTYLCIVWQEEKWELC